MTDNNNPHFVISKNFHGDNEYIEWLREIKSRYQAVRSRVALQANYGALEFNWLLGRDIVQKQAEARWGSGGVNQLSLDLREAYPDVKGFSARNLYYMKGWYEFYMADNNHKEILHQLCAKFPYTFLCNFICPKLLPSGKTWKRKRPMIAEVDSICGNRRTWKKILQTDFDTEAKHLYLEKL